jgi:tyrosyl-tRNA synthetase
MQFKLYYFNISAFTKVVLIMSNIVDILQKRGFIEAMTSQEIKNILTTSQFVYAGFDPTADSLHLGHLIPIIGLAWFQKAGHVPVAIVGGATGMVGDPSGKSKERNLLDSQTLEKNIIGIRKNLEAILDFNDTKVKPLLLNNFDWFKKFSFIDFLRDVGKHFRMAVMLSRDSVKSRLNSEEGLSFTEFSYQTLQAYDFLHLFDHFNVTIQLGGSDQWGNIVAGTELIRKIRSKNAFGITFPLLTRSDGKKFGKTEEGAIWLSKEKTSPYTFYQYLFSLPDADVIKLMKMLTFMDISEIEDWENKMKGKSYVPNDAQKKLALEVTRIVHGQEGVDIALKATEGVKPGSKTILDSSVLENISKDIPGKEFMLSELIGKKLLDVLVLSNLIESKAEARRLIKGGGVYLNNEKVLDDTISIKYSNIIDDKFLLLAVGKKQKCLIRIVD